MSAADWIAERARIEQAATDGPWVREWSTPDQWWIIHGQPNPAKGDDRMVCPEVATLNHREDWTADAEFIAAARDDVPRLLAGVRRLQAADERVRALHRPVDIEPSDTICGECSYGLRNGRYLPPVVEYPCPTIAALDGGE